MRLITFILALLFYTQNVFANPAFVTTWKTTNIGGSNDNQVNFQGIGNYNLHWEELGNASNMGDTSITGAVLLTFPDTGTYQISVTGNLQQFQAFGSGDESKLLTVNNWGDITWTNMKDAYNSCKNMQVTAIDTPNLTGVLNFTRIFSNCKKMNAPLDHWNISNVVNLKSAFWGASSFDQDLSDWDIRKVVEMEAIFNHSGISTTNYDAMLKSFASQNVKSNVKFGVEGLDYCTAKAARDTLINKYNWIFGQDTYSCDDFFITTWKTDNAGSTNNDQIRFRGWGSYNLHWEEMGNSTNFGDVIVSGTIVLTFPNAGIYQITVSDGFHSFSAQNSGDGKKLLSVDNWGDVEWTSMNGAFNTCENMVITAIDTPNLTSVFDCSRMFRSCKKMNTDLSHWNVSNVTNMRQMFEHAESFNQNINAWNVSNVTIMESMFLEAKVFNQPLSNWNVSKVVDMESIFFCAKAFNQPLNTWEISSATELVSIFSGAASFNQDISNWDVSSVKSMSHMFRGATDFNQPLNNWEVDSVQDFENMFRLAESFNQDISGWNTGSATDMESFFEQANSFNQAIGSWDVSLVEDFGEMFQKNTAFNQDISAWNTESAQYMDEMFDSATVFNQNLGDWNITNVDRMRHMFDFSGMSAPNYDATLIGWANQPVQSGVELGAQNIPYCEAIVARDTLIQNNNWTIVRDTFDCSKPFITTWQTDLAVNLPINTDSNQIRYPGVGSYMLYWEEVGNPQNNDSIDATGETVITFPYAGTYRVEASGDLQRLLYFTSRRDSEKLVSIDQWGTIEWLSMAEAFENCFNMEYNAVDIPDLSRVNNTQRMFLNCRKFNGDINNWETSTFKFMSGMFEGTTSFNQDLDDWDVSAVGNMRFLFKGSAFNGNISSWEVDNVYNMGSMFEDNSTFNNDISSWNVSNVQFMGFMFKNATAFNQNISNWNTVNVQKMVATFQNAYHFNQNLEHWNIQKVNDMENMFDLSGISAPNYDATLISWANQSVKSGVELGALNIPYCEAIAARDTLIQNNNWRIVGDALQCPDPFVTIWKTDNIGSSNDNQVIIPGKGNYVVSWQEVGNATNSGIDSLIDQDTITFPNIGTYLLEISGNFTQIRFNNSYDRRKIISIEAWGDIAWESMERAFEGCNNLSYNAIDVPDLSRVIDLSRMFRYCYLFNGAIGNWEVGTINNMEQMFDEASIFNQNVNDWDVSNVTNMKNMFYSANAFNQPLNNWEVSSVTNMEGLFRSADIFNQDINDWEVSNVVTMSSMFTRTDSFNQPLNNWDLSSVIDLSDMFSKSEAFNQDINVWNTSNVVDMSFMFSSAEKFNQPIGNWDVSKVTDMEEMFGDCSSFNQNLSDWNTANVENMNYLFGYATAFNQNLDDWNMSSVEEAEEMLDYSGLSRLNYDATLIGWASQSLQSDVELGATSLYYCNGEVARNSIIAQYNWDILGDTVSCLPFVTTWKTDNIGNGHSNNNEIEIPIIGVYDISWEEVGNPSNNGTAFGFGTTLVQFPTVGIYQVTISGKNFDQIRFFPQGDGGKLISIDQWGTTQWTSMNKAFYGCTNMEYNATDVPNLSQVTDMTDMFAFCRSFNGAIGNWDVSSVQNMTGVFSNCLIFNQDISEWKMDNVTSMENMFLFARQFNQDIGDWNVERVKNMHALFANAVNFNQNINDWKVDSVKIMTRTFIAASVFNQDLNNWNVEQVLDMESMFEAAIAFNKNIGNWKISNVTNLGAMFLDAYSFNHNLSDWDISNVYNLCETFSGASAFDQSLASWNMSEVVCVEEMLSYSNLSIANYDSTLMGWASLLSLKPNLRLGATGLNYCRGAFARQMIINDFGWTFVDNGYGGNQISIEATTCDPMEEGTTIDSLFSISGCDSIVTTVTTLLPSDAVTIQATTCDVNEVGSAEETFTNQFGCDSVVTTETTLLPSDAVTVQATTCDANEVGSAEETFTNQFGCDSVVTTETTLLPSDAVTVQATTCDANEVGSVEETFTNQFGCDSVVTTETTLLPSDAVTVQATTCDANEVGSVEETFTNQFGCDSVVTTETTLLPSDAVTVQATTCDANEVGSVEETFTNQFGCDSVVTTETTLLPSDAVIIQATTCDANEVGSVEETFTNQFGCDSVVTTETTLLPSDAVTVQATTCDANEVGSVEETFTNQFGCDSVVTTETTLLVQDVLHIEEYTCDSNEVNTQIDTFANSFGCDSIVQTTIVYKGVTANFNSDVNEDTVSFINFSANGTDYNWEFGDNNSSIANNPIHVYAIPGIYEVQLRSSNEHCSDTAVELISIDFTTSINIEVLLSAAIVYPNPSQGQFALELNAAQFDGFLEIDLMSLSGQLLERRRIFYQPHIKELFDISDSASGIYIINIKKKEESITLKLELLE